MFLIGSYFLRYLSLYILTSMVLTQQIACMFSIRIFPSRLELIILIATMALLIYEELENLGNVLLCNQAIHCF